MSGRLCAARQYGDMTACAPCQLSWDTNDEAPPRCPREPITDQVTVSDIAADPVETQRGISWPPGHPPTLAEFVRLAGYDELKPYQRNLIEMLDKQLAESGHVRRRYGRT